MPPDMLDFPGARHRHKVNILAFPGGFCQISASPADDPCGQSLQGGRGLQPDATTQGKGPVIDFPVLLRNVSVKGLAPRLVVE